MVVKLRSFIKLILSLVMSTKILQQTFIEVKNLQICPIQNLNEGIKSVLDIDS